MMRQAELSGRNNFPATEFLKDVIRMEQGQLTLTELRQRWANGDYAAVNPEWAREQMK